MQLPIAQTKVMAQCGSNPSSKKRDFLGFGLGLRTPHYREILNSQPAVDWFEAITENYLYPDSQPLNFLRQIRERYPVVLHGVGLSLGSTDPLNAEYLQAYTKLIHDIQPLWISDHLCWTGHNGHVLHDLYPLPYTEEAINHVVERIRKVQDCLGYKILIENVSSYLSFKDSCMDEWTFLSEIVERADSEILLDINNIYVSAFNQGFSPETYLYAIPKSRVRQFHLAGHTNLKTHIIDTHDAPIISEVWQLYAKACAYFGPVATMIERDDHIPELSVLLEELAQAKKIASAYWPQKSYELCS